MFSLRTYMHALLVCALAGLHAAVSQQFVGVTVANSSSILANISNVPYIASCDAESTMTGFQAMLLACATAPVNITFQYKVYACCGVFVSEINGISGNNQDYWAFSINGKTPPVGVDTVKLNPGDQLGWAYVPVPPSGRPEVVSNIIV